MPIHGTLASYGWQHWRIPAYGAAIVLGAAVTYVAAYATGVVTALGYETCDCRETPFYATDDGLGLGLSTMLLFEGQTLYVDYDIDVTEGVFRLHLYRLPMRREYRDMGLYKVFHADAAGRIDWPVPATGVYTLHFDADNVIGKPRHHDVSYTVTWGATF